jgi:MFS family permease
MRPVAGRGHDQAAALDIAGHRFCAIRRHIHLVFGNAVLAELMQRWASASPMAGWITSAVQLGFIAGTLVFAIFAVSDRFSPRWVFLVCAAAGALSNLLTGLAGNSLAWLLTLRFVLPDSFWRESTR